MSITRVGIAEKVSQLRSKVEDTARQNEATFRRCGVEAQRVPNYCLTNHLHFCRLTSFLHFTSCLKLAIP